VQPKLMKMRHKSTVYLIIVGRRRISSKLATVKFIIYMKNNKLIARDV
jgi:hypothetical protein